LLVLFQSFSAKNPLAATHLVKWPVTQITLC